MSQKVEGENKQKVDKLDTIENLCIKNNLPTSIFEGVKSYKGWCTGKKISEIEFKNAIKSFTGSPINKGGKK